MITKSYQLMGPAQNRTESACENDGIYIWPRHHEDKGYDCVGIGIIAKAKSGKTVINRMFKAVKQASEDGVLPADFSNWGEIMLEAHEYYEANFYEVSQPGTRPKGDWKTKQLFKTPKHYRLDIDELTDGVGWKMSLVEAFPAPQMQGMGNLEKAVAVTFGHNHMTIFSVLPRPNGLFSESQGIER